ncbi:MAG: leucine-rich repeat protein [Ruminococcus sp.]|nr:leucine-rich repeat protein [Ruminococcus sp.]
MELTAKLKKKIGDYDSTHECNLCIDGDTSAKTELSCELTFFGLDNLTWEHKFADWSLKLNEFYYSIDKKEFGWGSCPYDKHKIKVKVIVGGNDHPCENAHVSYGKESCITASDGIADFLISDGYHTITVSCDNCETVQQKIYVNGDDKDITVHLWAIDPAKTTTATTLKPSGTNQTVTTTATTVPAEQPDENGEYSHDGVIYKCYDDYAVVSGYTDDVPNEVVILKEVCGLPVTEIGYSAFYDCEKLTLVKIPDSVTSIGDFAFSGCKNITSITIPDSVTIIGEMAFNNCDRLTSITIPNSVITIGEASFINCESFTSITIPNSVTNIGYEAFIHCDGLTSITIPDSVTNIEVSAFKWCNELTDVYYSGTESQWNEITIGNENDCLTNATIHYNSTAPAPTPAPPVMKPYNESFADLKPNKLYNFYAFIDKNAVDKLSAENLLHIAQFTTDQDGNADIQYIPENDQILITEATYSIATADISIGDVVYTGSEVVPDIVVTWNGNQLTEGVDYETEGDLSAVNIGSYRILIKGTGEFSGYADVIYNVICSHNFADGICTICGDKKSETDVSEIILGDVNEDGMVNAIDATAVLEEYANLSTDRNGTFSDYQKLSGDINSDNMIDAVDASFILEFYAYLSTDGTESDMRVWLDIK